VGIGVLVVAPFDYNMILIPKKEAQHAKYAEFFCMIKGEGVDAEPYWLRNVCMTDSCTKN